jgi:hypothetical protein
MDVAGEAPMPSERVQRQIDRFLDEAEAAAAESEWARVRDRAQNAGQALEVAGGIRFRPEVALTRLQLAELLLEGTPEERTVASQHLDFAIEELRAMKMQLYLERALRHKGLLHA